MTTNVAPYIFIITGEPSGDALGGALIAALRRRVGDGLRIAGIGGERMREQGIDSLAPLSDLAIAGVTEVVPRAPVIFRHVRNAVAAIRAAQPDAVVTIDSSGFSWRIAQRLRRHGERLPLIHYVAPMVWAWRAGRARRMARWYDHLLALLPFEPLYFRQVGLECTYVGHPVIDSGAGQGDGARFRAAHRIASDEVVLTVLPGSRLGEVRRLTPIFAETLRQVEAQIGAFRVVVPTVETVAEVVVESVRDWPGRPIVSRGDAAKYDAFAASRAALAASGTVALELAMARLPMTVAYRLSRPTEILLDRVLKVRTVNLVNLILGRSVVAEHLGPHCTPERLSASLVELIRDEPVRATHREGYDAAIRLLGAGELSPSLRAADKILEIIAARRQQQQTQ
ncbi:MAG TPA: lipid-A-disaccharide synthase [Stellaceae bacterium]|jgi:lipid-A-disaccharide synthase|nr:lipid-A-disaccharide synthase [Stellaceae bacterium]